jgi:hypothetical protein
MENNCKSGTLLLIQQGAAELDDKHIVIYTFRDSDLATKDQENFHMMKYGELFLRGH